MKELALVIVVVLAVAGLTALMDLTLVITHLAK